MWLRAVLGAILTAMGLGQLVSWPAMPDILAAYRIGPAVVLPWMAAVLILAELAGGLWAADPTTFLRTDPGLDLHGGGGDMGRPGGAGVRP